MTQPQDQPPQPRPPKFLDQVRTALLIRSVTPELTKAYLGWVRAYIHFHALRHPETLGELDIGGVLDPPGHRKASSGRRPRWLTTLTRRAARSNRWAAPVAAASSRSSCSPNGKVVISSNSPRCAAST